MKRGSPPARLSLFTLVLDTQSTLTVFSVTKEAVVSRQAQVIDQLPPIPGQQRMAFTPVLPTPPEWCAEARIPLE